MTSLTDVTVYPLEQLIRHNAPITWVLIPGYIGKPRTVALLDRQPYVPDPTSMFGQLDRDNLFTVGHPRPGREAEYYDLLLKELSGNVILLGLSRGGQVANGTFRRYKASCFNGRSLLYPDITNLGLVLHSTPEGANGLRTPFRQLVKLVHALHVPSSWGRAIKPLAWFFTPGKVKRELRRQDKRWAIKLRRQSIARSPWVIDSLHALAANRPFGSPLDHGGCVVTLNMQGDKVVSLINATLAASYAYPKCLHFEYEGTDHGSPEVDGPQIAAQLNKIRAHFVELWGLED